MNQYNVVMQVSLRDPSPQNLARLRSSIGKSLSGIDYNVNTSGVSKAQKELQKLTKIQNEATKSAELFGEAIVLKGKNFAAYAVASTAILKVGSAFSESVQQAIRFEKQLAIIAQTTNTTLADTKKLTSSITAISKNYGLAQTEVAGFVRTFAQAGLSIKESLKAAELLSKTSLVGTFENIKDTQEAMIAIMSIFGRKANEVEKDLASLNAVSKAFAVENQDLVEVIKRSGGAFKAAGGEINELLALFTAIRSSSREAPESIATGLNTITGRLQRPKTIEFFKNLGIQLTDTEGKFIGTFKALDEIQKSLEKIGATQGTLKFAEIVEQLGGLRQQSRTIPALTKFKQAQEALNIAQKNNITLDQDAAIAKDTLAFKLDRLKTSFDALVNDIFESTSVKKFTGFLLDMASAATELARVLTQVLPLFLAFAGVGFAKGVVHGFAKVSPLNVLHRSKGGDVPGIGGSVPGIGDTDKVPALLTPGEFVIKKKAVKRLGLATLFRLNNVAGYAKGGEVDDFGEGVFATPEYRHPIQRINNSSTRREIELINKGLDRLSKSIDEVDKSIQELPAQIKNSVIGSKSSQSPSRYPIQRVNDRSATRNIELINKGLDRVAGSLDKRSNFESIFTQSNKTIDRKEFGAGVPLIYGPVKQASQAVKPGEPFESMFTQSNRTIDDGKFGAGVGLPYGPNQKFPSTEGKFGEGIDLQIDKATSRFENVFNRFIDHMNALTRDREQMDYMRDAIIPDSDFGAGIPEPRFYTGQSPAPKPAIVTPQVPDFAEGIDENISQLNDWSAYYSEQRAEMERQAALPEYEKPIKRRKATDAELEQAFLLNQQTYSDEGVKKREYLSLDKTPYSPFDAREAAAAARRRNEDNAANFLTRENRKEGIDLSPEGIQRSEQLKLGAFSPESYTPGSGLAILDNSPNMLINPIRENGPNGPNGPKGPDGPDGPKSSTTGEKTVSDRLSRLSGTLGLVIAAGATFAQQWVSDSSYIGDSTKNIVNSFLSVVQGAGILQTFLGELGVGIGDLIKVGFSKSSRNKFAEKIKDYSSGFSAKGGIVGRFGDTVGKYANGIAKFGAAVSAATIGVGAIASLNTVIDGVVDAEGKKKKAIEKGDIVEASVYASYSQTTSDLNKFNYGLVAVSALFGPLGAGIGVAIAATIKLASVFTPLGKVINSVVDSGRNLLAFFNLADSTDVVKEKARSAAANNLVGININKFTESSKKDLSLNTEKSRARVLNDPKLKELAKSVFVSKDFAIASGDKDLMKQSSEVAKEAFSVIEPLVNERLKSFVGSNIKSGKNISFEDFEKSLTKSEQMLINISGAGIDLKKDFENLSDAAKNEKLIIDNLNAAYDAEQIIYRKKIEVESQLNNSLLSLSKAAEDSSQALSAIQSAANPEALQSIGSGFSSQLGDINNIFDPVSFSKSLVAASKIGAGAGNADILKGVDFAKQIRGPGGLTQKALELGGKSFISVQQELASSSENPQRQEEILDEITSGIVSNIKGADAAVSAKLANGFKDIIKHAEGRIDPKAVEDLLVDTLVTPAQELANKQKEAIEKQIAILNNYSASLRAINETDQKILESKLSSLKDQQDFSNSLTELRTGKPTGTVKLGIDSAFRQAQILSGEKDSGKLIGNADALSDAIKQTENRIYRLNERFQAGEALDKASVEQQEANKQRLEKLNKALDEQITTFGELKVAALESAKAERDKAKQLKDELLAKVTKPIQERIKDASAEADANKILRDKLNPNVISSQFAAGFTGQNQSLIQEQQSRIIAALQRKAEGEGPEAEKAKSILNQISSNSASFDAGLQNKLGGFTSQKEISILEKRAKRGDKKAIEALAIAQAQNSSVADTQNTILNGTTKKGLLEEAKAQAFAQKEANAIKERESALGNRREIQRGELSKLNAQPAQPQGLQEKDIVIMQQFAKSMQPIAESMKKFVEMPKEFTHKFDAAAMTVNIPAAAILEKLPTALKLVILEEINSQIGMITKKVKEQLQAGG